MHEHLGRGTWPDGHPLPSGYVPGTNYSRVELGASERPTVRLDPSTWEPIVDADWLTVSEREWLTASRRAVRRRRAAAFGLGLSLLALAAWLWRRRG